MSVLVVASRQDPAAVNIATNLTSLFNFHRAEHPTVELWRSDDVFLAYVDMECIHADSVDEFVEADAIIFASKHRSESREPTLTVHTTGNPTSQALYGGSPKTLSIVDPHRMKTALLSLESACKRESLDYQVTFEATHHGPTDLEASIMFVEVGSTDDRWRDHRAGKVAAEAIWAAAIAPSNGKIAVGFGGGHYPRKFVELVVNENLSVGHILSKYFFEEFDSNIVSSAFAKTRGECKTAIIDWKGMRGRERSQLLNCLDELSVEITKV